MALISLEAEENGSHLYLCPHLLNKNIGVASMYAAANISSSVAHTDGLCMCLILLNNPPYNRLLQDSKINLQHCVACMML